jgi:hypothetical protein
MTTMHALSVVVTPHSWKYVVSRSKLFLRYHPLCVDVRCGTRLSPSCCWPVTSPASSASGGRPPPYRSQEPWSAPPPSLDASCSHARDEALRTADELGKLTLFEAGANTPLQQELPQHLMSWRSDLTPTYLLSFQGEYSSVTRVAVELHTRYQALCQRQPVLTYDEKAFLAKSVYGRDHPPAMNLEP